ncbi:MAG TPA: lysozyme inhibitor LprI family protein [Pyrinomonadaceae bacterium]|nr:lysozyme inhibitor LprI family protein [Pyrinomonadaceae bacterium]
MKLVTVFALLFLMAGAYAFGQGKKTEPCADAQTQSDMNICWGNQYKSADTQLNKTYQQLAALLEADEKAQLKNAETAWIKYRDANCDFTIRPMIYAICLADVTNNRTTELKNQIKDRNQ